MAPLTPFWTQPSHPEIQEVEILNADEFSSRSLSKIDVPPNGLFANMNFPPCTSADKPTYATVQMGRDKHLNLNSDLVYINHSCEPSLVFDMAKLQIRASPSGLKSGQELTFFYPSTEWSMDQAFDCLCGTKSCLGRISGAKDMSDIQLKGYWLNRYIEELIVERENSLMNDGKVNGYEAAGVKHVELANGNIRESVTSREMSGEMGGDTIVV